MFIESGTISIQRTTKGTIPSLPFFAIAEAVLGKKYTLSVTFATRKYIQELNIHHRGKSYVPNTLAFPLSTHEGDIIMSLSTIRSQAKDFDMNYMDFLTFLFIHSCLHLKGFEHGSTMEKLEKKYLTQFAPHATYPYDAHNRN